MGTNIIGLTPVVPADRIHQSLSKSSPIPSANENSVLKLVTCLLSAARADFYIINNNN